LFTTQAATSQKDYIPYIARISYGNSVRLSVFCPTRPGTDPRPGERENSGFYHYYSLEFLVFRDKIFMPRKGPPNEREKEGHSPL